MTYTDTFRPRVLLNGEQSGDSVSAVEIDARPDFAGPPLHTHDFDETFYVLDGELTFRLEDQLLSASTGDLVLAPRGVPHTLANLSGREARYLLVCTPAGFERHFARVAAEQAGTKPPGWADGPNPEVIEVGGRIADATGLGHLERPRPPARGTYTVLLRSEETGDVLSVVESVVPPGAKGPPLHRHPFDEAFYLLEGELRFQLGDELHPARPGELAFAPREVGHTLANHGERPARFLIVFTPGGVEREFARRAAARDGTAPPDWAMRQIPEVTVLGPPLAA